MNVRVRSVVGSGLLVVGLAAAAGCGRSSPVSPTAAPASGIPTVPVGRAAGQPVVHQGGTLVTVSLQGTFTISNDSGDSLSGTYTGTAVSSTGTAEQALLTLRITGGTGVYAGASGSADASGLGAFSGEGGFSIGVRGDALLQSGKHAQITLNISGTSTASCLPVNQFVITQTGGGTMGRAGRVTSIFQHQVSGGAGCISG